MASDSARIQHMLYAASRLRGEERDRFLSEECGGGDGAVRREVESLLAALDRAPDLLEASPV